MVACRFVRPLVVVFLRLVRFSCCSIFRLAVIFFHVGALCFCILFLRLYASFRRWLYFPWILVVVLQRGCSLSGLYSLFCFSDNVSRALCWPCVPLSFSALVPCSVRIRCISYAPCAFIRMWICFIRMIFVISNMWLALW